MTCNLILASYVYSNHSCNFFGIEIEVSNCGSIVRYRIGENGAVSKWKEIHYTKGGRPFFEVSKKAHGCARYYLNEFMKI